MTKLEQCVRLANAIEEGSVVELSFRKLLVGTVNEKFGFTAKVLDRDSGEVAVGVGSLIDDAIDALHDELRKHAGRLREALAGFDR